jgi:hypothetical protein
MSDIIPTGQSYREIGVTVSYGSSLGFETTDRDSALVSIKKDGQTIKILAFCRYSRIVLRAAEGCSFGSELTPTKEDVTYEVEEHNERSIQLAVHNTNHSTDAGPKKLKLKATINGQAFCIQVNNPAYQQVDVIFNNGSFTYGDESDIDVKANPPTITFKRRGAAYFTLTGATFDTEPFFWDKGKDSCIIDEGEDGSHAILTNLHNDSNKSQHSFLLQVTSGGVTYQSEDPTIVNVEPPPPSGY